jgi:hypothetical protein
MNYMETERDTADNKYERLVEVLNPLRRTEEPRVSIPIHLSFSNDQLFNRVNCNRFWQALISGRQQ